MYNETFRIYNRRLHRKIKKGSGCYDGNNIYAWKEGSRPINLPNKFNGGKHENSEG